MEVVLACTPTSGLIDTLKLAFSRGDVDPASFPPMADPKMTKWVDEEGNDVEEDPDDEELPEGSVSTFDKDTEQEESKSGSKTGRKRKATGGKSSVPKRPRDEIQPDELPPRYDLYSGDIKLYYPTVEFASQHHIGVNKTLVGKRENYGELKTKARYRCEFVSGAESVGLEVRDEDRDCDFWTQQSSATVTHIRKVHLGIALGCRYCDYRNYSGTQWKIHMQKYHGRRPMFIDSSLAHMQGASFEITGEVDEETLVAAAQVKHEKAN